MNDLREESPRTPSPGPSTGAPAPVRIVGPERMAVRAPGRPTWILVRRETWESDGLPLGARVELDRPDEGRRDTASSQRGLPDHGPGWRPSVSPIAVSWVGALAFGAGVVGLVGGGGRLTLAFAGLVTSFGGMGMALAALWATFLALRWSEAGAVGRSLEGDGAWLRLGPGTLRVEPAAWRVGAPGAAGAAPVLLALGAYVGAAGWSLQLPAPAAGVAIGAVLYLVQALYPLKPGPGSAILEGLTGTRDLPVRLRWALVSRFVPVPTRLRVEGSGAMTLPAVAFAVWASASGGALWAMGGSPATGATLAGRLWQVVFVVGLILYAAWLAWRVVELVLSAALLRPGAAIKPMGPSDTVSEEWARRNPLTRHLPSLKDAEWRWGTAPRGALLVRYGARESHFLWIAEGIASVVARSPDGDPQLVAELRAGGGVGEIALLEDRPRTADVIAQEPSVVAMLDRAEFDRVTDADDRARFRELVEASQALGRSSTLYRLPADERGVWLAGGRAQRFDEGDDVVRQDERARWLGLIVRGRVVVEQDGRTLATLGPDEIFGEMAWLGRGMRKATLRAAEETLVWRWDEDFLDREVGHGAIRDDLEDLARERSS